MRKIYLGALILVVLIGLAVAIWGRPFYQRHIVLNALEIAQSDPACFFDGQFIQGDVPVVRLVPAGDDILTVWADFRNRFLNAERAKPFHFGMFVIRGAQSDSPTAEAWGWSYRKGAFWPARLQGFVDLAYNGDPINDCLMAQ